MIFRVNVRGWPCPAQLAVAVAALCIVPPAFAFGFLQEAMGR